MIYHTSPGILATVPCQGDSNTWRVQQAFSSSYSLVSNASACALYVMHNHSTLSKPVGYCLRFASSGYKRTINNNAEEIIHISLSNISALQEKVALEAAVIFTSGSVQGSSQRNEFDVWRAQGMCMCLRSCIGASH